MKLTKLVLLLSISIFFVNAYADTVPDRCPSIKALSEVGIDRVFKWPFGEYEWIGVKDEVKYDTNAKWYFSLSTITAKTEGAAILLAPEYIKGLKWVSGPELDDNDSYSCVYRGVYQKQEISALAIHVTM